MLKMTGVVIVVLIAGVLLQAATKPDTFRVQRSATIQAPPEKIFPLINDLRAFNGWNPFEKKDPNLKGRYNGSSSGRGAAYAFDGTNVTWAMQGPAPYIAKVIHMFLDMDKMVGRDFEAGLAALKAIVEK